MDKHTRRKLYFLEEIQRKLRGSGLHITLLQVIATYTKVVSEKAQLFIESRELSTEKK